MRHAKCDDYNGLPTDSKIGPDLGALINRAFVPIPVVPDVGECETAGATATRTHSSGSARTRVG
jgi:hypothetical protein